ncbi:MAG: hypothetical protein ABSA92_05090 [Candidatus Bathyarchaeia archaeon]
MRKTKFWMALIAISLVALTVTAVPASQQMGFWRDINPDAYISPPANPQLNSVYMLSPHEGWAVGDSQPTTIMLRALPAIFHYDGSTWNLVPAPQVLNPPIGGSPGAYNLTSVTFGPPNNPITNGTDGWTVGFQGLTTPLPGSGPPTFNDTSVALHWDGITWRTQTAGLTTPNAGPLWSAFMVSSTDVWAVGQTQSSSPQGVFWHWTGVPGLGGGWNNIPPSPVPAPLYSVFMVSATEGWAVGATGSTGSNIYHYFGGAWNNVASPVTTTLRSLYMLSPTEGWAVGDGGIIIHYSSGTWAGPVSPGTTSNNLVSVFMTSSTDGWAFGVKGTILHYSGGSWTALPSNLVPTSPVPLLNFNSGYFNGADDGWAVGTDGVVLHFNGVNYGTVTSPTINNFTSISFGPPLTGPINPNDGWAVGNASIPLLNPPFNIPVPDEPTIYHWDGFAWTKGVAIGTLNNLNSVFMVNSGDVWTVGGGLHSTSSCASGPGVLCPIILHYTGGSWNSISPPPGSYVLRSIFMVNSGEGWAVGAQTSASGSPTGIILHYEVTAGVGTWGVFPSPTSPAPIPALESVFMLNQYEGWAVGDDATILHYTVSGGIGTWSLVSVSGTPSLSQFANLTSVFMLSPSSGWAVGGLQVLPPTGPPLNAVAGPVIIYWDGTKWEPVAAPSIPGGISPYGHTDGMLKSVFFTKPDDGWAVGFPGNRTATILHWDGTAWAHVSLSPSLLGEIPPILSSVYMTSPENGWIVGGSPDFACTTPIPCTTSLPPAGTGLSQYFGSTGPQAPGIGGPYGYKTPLSTMLRFSPFGGVLSATTTIVSTIFGSTTAFTTQASTSSTTTMPSNITISIKVVNNQGTVLQGITVTIPALGLQGVTNSQGIVTFTLPPGNYAVTFSQGSTSGTQTITAASDGQQFTVTLNVSSSIPGFPVESIIAGIVGGVIALMLLRRRRNV